MQKNLYISNLLQALQNAGLTMFKEGRIGQKIRHFRREKGLTLNQLGEAAALSSPYLSQLENEKASPSIATLRRIASALNIRIVDFFTDELIEDPPILPESNWTRLVLPDWEAELHQLVHIVGNKRMQPFHTKVPPGGGTRKQYAHPGEEFGFIVDGELMLTLGDETHRLLQNTAVYFSSLLPHSWRNLSDRPCRLIWVISPPSW